MSDLLFDVPWWIPAVIAIVGVLLVVQGNRRQNRPTRQAGLGFLALAVGWALLSYFVDTPKETCQKLTRRLVNSVVQQDWTTMHGLLAPGVTFGDASGSWRISGRDALEKEVQAEAQRIGLQSAHISGINASEQADQIIVTITVFSDQKITLDSTIRSVWDMHWRKINGQYQLIEITEVQLGGLSNDQVRGMVPRH